MLVPFGRTRAALLLVLACALAAVLATALTVTARTPQTRTTASPTLVSRGQEIFRFDTFGNEPFWTNTLELGEVIEQAVSPIVALAVGLKVDASVLPSDFLATHDLTLPQTTIDLLALDAVVGVKAAVNGNQIEAIGITCALCHSTVDSDTGIGLRLDGWPNLDLDPGRIIALSPNLSPELKTVYNSWGPGWYDPRFNIDGINAPVRIPPAYGLAGVRLETYTGDGPLPYWNNYVAVTQMQGQGVFIDHRIGVQVVRTPDLVHPKLAALEAYQLSLPAPEPPAGSFNAAAATRGQNVFNGVGRCSSCHLPPTFTDVNLRVLHRPAETGMEPLYASRSATKLYRTTPLRALWQHPPYFHDGSAATLVDVVNHYDAVRRLFLTDQEKADLVEYLKSL